VSAIRPNREQFLQLAQSPDTGAVVMLNLLKFKEAAQGESGSGQDAYQRYGDAAVAMIEKRGGSIIWQGRADQILIGDPSEDWDTVVLVKYPSRKAFIEMVSNPEYEKAHEHREAGLERTIVVACSPVLDRIRESAASS
jgi:uncharacterized protein (DUF1330 family)